MMQLSLLSPAIATEAELPILGIRPVPLRLAIGPNRFYITVSQGSRSWDYPIQFKEREIERILPRVRRLNWALGSDGAPVDVEAIHGTVGQAIDGGLV